MSWKKPNKKVLRVTAILLLAVLWTTAVSADSIPPQIHMRTGWEHYEPGVIKTTVIDDTKVENVKLFYRISGESYYNSVDMKRRNDIYYQELDRELGLEGTVEYYLLAQDTSGNEVTEPRMNPEENPMTAAASELVDTSAPEVTISNPEPGSTLDTGDEPVMITFYTTEREIDFNTIRFKIDKRDRTREVDFFGNVLYWEPRRPLSNGFHEIEVTVKSTDGEYLGPNIWTFRVKTKNELPLNAEGDVYVGLQRNDRSGESHSVPLFNNKIDLGLQGQNGWLKWSGGIMLSSEESAFLTSETIPDRQPINRFYFDGRSRHFRVRIGDSNPNFSELTMKGILVRGFNAEFKSNRFQAGFVTGYNKRDIGEDVYIVEKNVIVDPTNPNQYTKEGENTPTVLASNHEIVMDPVTGRSHVYEFLPGTFKRNITALQADVVPVKSKWATWKIGLNMFSAEDDSTSLSYSTSSETRDYMYNGAAFATNYKPKKNWAGTVETSLRFWDNRSELTAEFGGTLITENMFSSIPEDIQEELPDTIDDELFRFNASTQTSFDKQKLSDNVGSGVSDAVTSVYKVRLTTPIPIPNAATHFKGEMYRIPTHYASLGNPQQKTDIGGIKFDVRTRILKDQVTLNLRYDSYSDNLDSERKQYAAVETVDGNEIGGTQKDLTKDTTITSFSVSARPRVFMEYLPNVTIGFRTYTAQNNLDANISANKMTDTIDAATNTLMLSFGGTLPVGMQKHTGTLSISSMGIDDNRSLPKYMLNESSNLTTMFNVNSIVNPLPLSINTSIGRTNNSAYRPLLDATGMTFDRKSVDTGITILNLAGTYKWFRDKRLSTTAGIGFLSSSNGETGMYEIDNSKFSIKTEANYRLTSVATVGATIRYISYTDNASSFNDYTEPIIGFTLRSAF